MKRMFQIIEDEYYGEIDRGVNPYAHEHIFDGQKYLIIKEKTFMKTLRMKMESGNFKYHIIDTKKFLYLVVAYAPIFSREDELK